MMKFLFNEWLGIMRLDIVVDVVKNFLGNRQAENYKH